MMLNVDIYKIEKNTGKPFYKTYRFPAFDVDINFDDVDFSDKFTENFNKAFDLIKDEIINDDKNEKMYGSATISSVYIT